MKYKPSAVCRQRLALAAMLLALPALAQTTPPTIGDFFNQIPAYFTSFDTNTLVAQGSRLEIFNDMLSGSTLGLSGLLGARVNFAAPKTAPHASANTAFGAFGMRYAGVGGVVSGGDVALGYSVVKWDARLSLVVSGGYDKTIDNRGGGYIAPGIWVEKAASKIIPGIGIELPVLIHRGGAMSFSGSPQFRIKATIPF